VDTLLRLARTIDRLNEFIGRWVSWLGLAAVVICAAAATARYALNIGSNAWLEIQWYLNSAVFLLVAGYTLKRHEHVNIDVLAGKLSPRVQAWIHILGGIFMLLPATVIIAWYSWPSLVNSYAIQEYSSDPGGLIRGRLDMVRHGVDGDDVEIALVVGGQRVSIDVSKDKVVELD